jgi:cobalt-zinc-cadmium efflux system membrane fusion protein
MKNYKILTLLTVAAFLFTGFTAPLPVFASSAPEVEQAEPEKGPNRGRMLRDGDIAVELSIFETGVPPEFRVWITDVGMPVSPDKVDFSVQLTRLGNVVDDIKFRVEGDFLRGDLEIYEPHSFVVTIMAKYQGKTHRWEYDNFEGRTQIEPDVASAMAIETDVVGPKTLHQTIPAYGRLSLPANATHNISARFDGVIKTLLVQQGDVVKQGQVLMTVESNESLKPYQITSPSDGIISEQYANAGEPTGGKVLLRLTNTAHYLAKLAIYPQDYTKVEIGTPVTIKVEGDDRQLIGKVELIEQRVRDDQAKLVWVTLPNLNHSLAEGSFVNADLEIASINVPVAVKKIGLQGFRDFTVVYAKVGEQYEVRMLELGREDSQWIEVLGGIEVGTTYVTENSYIIKADIEKSGASHDH